MDLKPGDVFATRGTGVTGWAVRNLLSPSTNRFHFGILWRKLGDDDFLTFESISKGLSLGKLSWYDLRELEFYRVDCPVSLSHMAAWGLIDWGRARYDYSLIAKLILGGLLAFAKILIKERKVRKLRAEDFPYGQNNALICTEVPDVAYSSVGVNIVPIGVIPIPNSFKEAEIEGRMSRIIE